MINSVREEEREIPESFEGVNFVVSMMISGVRRFQGHPSTHMGEVIWGPRKFQGEP